MLLVGIGQEPADGNVYTSNLRVVRSYAENVDVLKQIISGTEVRACTEQRRNLAGRVHTGFQTDKLLPGDQGPLLGLDPGVLAGNDAHAVQDVDVGTEVGDAV